jgi:GTP cyclohydrolase II
LPGSRSVAITARRAGTLKARAYDGDLARIVMPPDADARGCRDLADPARDLMAPMKGPLQPCGTATRRCTAWR